VNIDLVITQLKTAALFYGNVAGAAAYERAVEDQTWMSLPSAYVVPLDAQADEMANETGYWQNTTERIGVICVLDNSTDRRGQTAVATVDQVQKAIFRAILNWRPDSTADNPGNASVQQDYETRGFIYDGARLLGWDLARLFYQWDFKLNVLITDDDGWQPNQAPLTSITQTYTNDVEVTTAVQST
jgi:hypothetical protein